MKKLSICVAILLVAVMAILLMRWSSNDSQVFEVVSVPEAGIEWKFNVDHAINESPKDSQVSDLVPSLESKTQQEIVAPIVAGSQMATSGSHAKNEVPMNMPEHDETIPVLDEEHRRFVRIAFELAKDAMEITDTSTATVEYTDNIVTVTFPFPRQAVGDRPPCPGPDYFARVKIDRATGNVLEILGAP